MSEPSHDESARDRRAADSHANSSPDALDVDSAEAEAHTRAWVAQAVIGLDLCPFAGAVASRGLVRYAVSRAVEPEALLVDLLAEMQRLVDTDPNELETTLLIHPHALQDFIDYNDFLDVADAALVQADLEGVLQIASFHPDYRFQGVDDDDITNATNRSPYPVLQLLRETSVERALDTLDDPDDVYEANIETMTALGSDGWKALGAHWRAG